MNKLKKYFEDWDWEIFFHILPMILVIAAISGGGIFLLHKLMDEYDVRKEKVGTEIIFKGDTLSIVGYEFWNDSYTLEDSRKFDRTFIESLNELQ
jgi:hypothetical protein